MDEFDVERLLPTLFFLVMTGGRLRGPLVNDPLQLDEYVERLQAHPEVIGFQGDAGKRLLDRWVRSSVVSMSRVGKGKKDEKIEFVYPLSLLAYKAGWPDETARQRNVDRFLYLQMIRLLRERSPDGPPASQKLKRMFMDTFGGGLSIDEAPPYDGRYDGSAELDADTLLCLRFLDGLDPTHPSGQPPIREEDFPAVLPDLATDMAADILQFMLEYRKDLPTAALTRALLAIINFELFVYTMKLFCATNELVRTRQLPEVMVKGTESAGSPPELYVDFTRQRDSASDDLARVCAQRDLLTTRVFLESLIRLRTLDAFAETTSELHTEVTDRRGGDYLCGLLVASDLPAVQARAEAELGLIREQSLGAASAADEDELRAYFSELLNRPRRDSVDRFVTVLTEAQAKTRVESLVKWLGSVGGLNRSFGILRGVSMRRSSWRYQMTDDLLTALVQLAIVRDETQQGRRISLARFRDFLESRFGVLIARPPTAHSDTGARLAAADNMEALKRRLRQMGFFADLSDDFSAQYLQFPVKGAG